MAPAITQNPSTHFMPPRLRTRLRFNAHLTLNNAGQVYSNNRYMPTYAYDIDPTLGSTAMPGFSELGALYRQYRVNAFTFKATFSNNEAFPVIVYALALNGDPGANATNYQNFLSNRECKKKTIGPLTGMGTATLRGRETVSSFAGMANTLGDDNTCGPTSGSSAPNQNIWFAMGIVGSSNLVNGVYVEVDLDIDIEFFELSTPAS